MRKRLVGLLASGIAGATISSASAIELEFNPFNPISPIVPKDSPLNPVPLDKIKDAAEDALKATNDTLEAIFKAADPTKLLDADPEIVAAFLLFPPEVRALPGFEPWFAERARQAAKDLENGINHLGDEIERGIENVGEAIEVSAEYIGNQIEAHGKVIADAADRVREGKIADAFWHAAVDPYKHTEANAAKAMQESSLLRTVGQVAASVYGGPGGAAAFAAWYAYRATGDAELALRVGLIAGASNYAMGSIGEMPDSQLIQKTTMAGAVGGLGAALGGGDPQAVQEGFIRGGGMILVQDGYRRVVNQPGTSAEQQVQLNDETLDAPSRGAFCMAAAPTATCAPPEGSLILEGKKVVDIDFRYADPDAAHVGIFSQDPATMTGLDPLVNFFTGETGPVMTGVAQIPGMNAMSLFHDRWAIVWQMDKLSSIATIPPATVLIYLGTDAPLREHLIETAINANADEGPAAADAPAVSAPDTPAAEPQAAGDYGTDAGAIKPDAEYVLAHGRREIQMTGRNIGVHEYQCIAPDRYVRSITINGPAENREIACSVVASDEKGVRGVWHSHIDLKFCRSKTQALMASLAKRGMACLERQPRVAAVAEE